MTTLLENKQKTITSLFAAFFGLGVLWFSVPKIASGIIAYQDRLGKMTVQITIPFDQRKKIEKEIVDIQTAIRSSDKKGASDYSDQYMELGKKYEKLGYRGKAEHAYRKALHESPKNTEVLLYLGSVLSAMEEYEKSIATFREAIELNPSNEETYRAFAEMVAFGMKNSQEARGIYIEGLMRTKNSPQLLKSFAAFLEKIGYAHEARQYQKTLSKILNPKP